jgi:hypothetical protein
MEIFPFFPPTSGTRLNHRTEFLLFTIAIPVSAFRSLYFYGSKDCFPGKKGLPVTWEPDQTHPENKIEMLICLLKQKE